MQLHDILMSVPETKPINNSDIPQINKYFENLFTTPIISYIITGGMVIYSKRISVPQFTYTDNVLIFKGNKAELSLPIAQVKFGKRDNMCCIDYDGVQLIYHRICKIKR